MDFKTFLKTSTLRVDLEITNILQSLSSDAKAIHPALIPLIAAFVDRCNGGKKLRGAFVLLGYLLGDGKNNNNISTIAASFEIFHSAILVHDDIIDKSPTRRGKKSLYQELGGDHYGISQAISIGDIGYFLAIKSISKSNFPDDKKNKAIELFTKCVVDTGLGQMLDVALPQQITQTEKDVAIIMRYKTARYSITTPLQLGAVLANNNSLLLTVMEEFGEQLGIAYQLQDDILGIFGTEDILGKSVMSDIEEGKITVLFLKAKENATPKQAEILTKFYGKKIHNTTTLDEIRNVFRETGALEYTQSEAERYMKKAMDTIPKLTHDKKLQKLLRELIGYLAERKY